MAAHEDAQAPVGRAAAIANFFFLSACFSHPPSEARLGETFENWQRVRDPEGTERLSRCFSFWCLRLDSERALFLLLLLPLTVEKKEASEYAEWKKNRPTGKESMKR